MHVAYTSRVFLPKLLRTTDSNLQQKSRIRQNAIKMVVEKIFTYK
jgi:hypothetical protein